ncbi:hypothetical protein DO021_19705 [Desulfobacter hydrogenophilus]|uniref:Uncharacterized protein n=1 Tax=Desulfobacter hydrogenophilus TaxID=2291 RepID=A0A328FAA1_9BACT|nr:hypothetical protein [Desulfobacter hydrogenophilus]NDY73995.1 hypothetical protein [Desulfobacter hydrogenophilus]QBH14340.1 hypothetical protein EYB58_16305 [Desulfobacter hydrogenophilus]RAM00342.1 hypothetical protein DO021_19705 [Desulfobacter hydrogenophilus]
MELNRFGSGPYLAFTEEGTVLSHGDSIVDCAAWQADDQVTVDVCMDADGKLKFGVEDARVYVANIVIPGKQYVDQTLVDAEGVPMLDENGMEQLERVALPLDMGQVIGNLWTLPAEDMTSATDVLAG